MNEKNDEDFKEKLIQRVIAMGSMRHAEDMRAASALLSEFFSKDPDDVEFMSSGDEGSWDTGFGMMIFAGTMRALFEGTEEVLQEVAEIPRGARRRIAKVQATIKERHIQQLKDLSNGFDDDLTE